MSPGSSQSAAGVFTQGRGKGPRLRPASLRPACVWCPSGGTQGGAASAAAWFDDDLRTTRPTVALLCAVSWRVRWSVSAETGDVGVQTAGRVASSPSPAEELSHPTSLGNDGAKVTCSLVVLQKKPEGCLVAPRPASSSDVVVAQSSLARKSVKPQGQVPSRCLRSKQW